MSFISLKKRAITGSIWTIGGTGFSQLLRLVGNLALTRILFPEAFGLMALVQVFIIGVTMLSDIGISASIIQNKRCDKEFLNTAWTLQVIRGFCLWLILCAIAWPASNFYEEPMLLPLLIVGGFGSVIAGFQSTKIIIANRNLQLKKITIADILSALVGMLIMILAAWYTESVWSLVIGGLFQTILKTILSFTYFSGLNNNFHWDISAAKSIYKYGRWLMLSSILTFLAGQSDKLIIGYIFDTSFLGIYGISLAIISVIYLVSQKLGAAVFFPSYSEIVRERPNDLYAAVFKGRLAQVILFWPASVILLFGGVEIVDFLYDSRYIDAGWILETLSLGLFVGTLRASYSGVLIALGKTGISTILLAIQILVTYIFIFSGYYFGGKEGVILGFALVSVALYPVDAYIYAKLSLWQPKLDFPLIIISAIVCALYYLI